MANIRISKQFRFEMAHVLLGYDGPCKNVHGHSYELTVTVKGEPNHDITDPKVGMVMDFGDLKSIVRQQIIDVFDHSLVLNKRMPKEVTSNLQAHFEKVILLDYQPTSEMMVTDFARRIASLLPEKLKLVHVLLRETATSYAEWFAIDNP
jgi:6-pyruvoyltetrahydropterin/6-carboxytetrahydropterin synthase